MATADQIKMLIHSHFEDDEDRFNTIVLQLAAYEAQNGHKALARDIRDIIDNSKKKVSKRKVIPFNKDLSDMILVEDSIYKLSNLVVSQDIKEKIKRIIIENKQREKLEKFGLNSRRKILIAGPPGTGKTLTASVLANELNLPICTIMVDKLITKFMGETSVKLRQIFENVKEVPGVYLFDEFDAIGAERSMDNDVGEMRRILNSFLQFIEQDDSNSLIVAATNNPKMLDQALFRRFDDVLHYKLPERDQIKSLILNRLSQYLSNKLDIEKIVDVAKTLSHSEITKACNDAIKELILNDLDSINTALMERMLQERKEAYMPSGGN